MDYVLFTWKSQSDEPQMDPSKKVIVLRCFIFDEERKQKSTKRFCQNCKNLFVLSIQLHQKHFFAKIVKFKIILKFQLIVLK